MKQRLFVVGLGVLLASCSTTTEEASDRGAAGGAGPEEEGASGDVANPSSAGASSVETSSGANGCQGYPSLTIIKSRDQTGDNDFRYFVFGPDEDGNPGTVVDKQVPSLTSELDFVEEARATESRLVPEVTRVLVQAYDEYGDNHALCFVASDTDCRIEGLAVGSWIAVPITAETAQWFLDYNDTDPDPDWGIEFPLLDVRPERHIACVSVPVDTSANSGRWGTGIYIVSLTAN